MSDKFVKTDVFKSNKIYIVYNSVNLCINTKTHVQTVQLYLSTIQLYLNTKHHTTILKITVYDTVVFKH